MSKPTVFFSHSSIDKEVVSLIKEKLNNATNSTLDLFVSSDGQSIRVGTNWVYRLEEALGRTQIMFIILTENSVSSEWIYFEAGYAYSKNIAVIPIGLGVDIGALRAPLSLLQGFNLTSFDSLNNLISIINEKFSYNFKSSFTEADYNELISTIAKDQSPSISFQNLISSTSYELNTCDNNTNIDVEQEFENIVAFLKENNIQYSLTPIDANSNEICLVVKGIKIVLSPYSTYTSFDFDSISFSLSSYNFETSFDLLQQILSVISSNSPMYLRFTFKSPYTCMSNLEDCASLVSAHKSLFALHKKNLNTFLHIPTGINFRIYTDPITHLNIPGPFISIWSTDNLLTAKNIVGFLNTLFDIGLIYEG